MKAFIDSIFVTILAFLLSHTSLRGQFALYGADFSEGNSSNLHILDKSDGSSQSIVGNIGFAVSGLAIHPQTGVMFGSVLSVDPTAPGHLITIDRETGAGTIVGSFGFSESLELGSLGLGPQIITDLTFDPMGRLFGWTIPQDNDIFQIDINTGLATRVGESGLPTPTVGEESIFSIGFGLEFDSSGTLYLSGFGVPEGEGASLTHVLHTVDPTTGSVLDELFLMGDIASIFFIVSLAFDEENRLFGSALGLTKGEQGENFLINIDTGSGETTTLGELGAPPQLFPAIVFDPIPEPSTLALSLVGVLVLFSVYRRR